jgi:hypothetical protein
MNRVFLQSDGKPFKKYELYPAATWDYGVRVHKKGAVTPNLRYPFPSFRSIRKQSQPIPRSPRDNRKGARMSPQAITNVRQQGNLFRSLLALLAGFFAVVILSL